MKASFYTKSIGTPKIIRGDDDDNYDDGSGGDGDGDSGGSFACHNQRFYSNNYNDDVHKARLGEGP